MPDNMRAVVDDSVGVNRSQRRSREDILDVYCAVGLNESAVLDIVSRVSAIGRSADWITSKGID